MIPARPAGRRRYAAALAGLALLAALALAAPAAADHVVVELDASAPASADGQIELAATVRSSTDGALVEGAEVTFWMDVSAFGVDGDVRLGSAISDAAGLAVLERRLDAAGDHQIRAEVTAGGTAEPVEAVISIDAGSRRSVPAEGISIPGLGGWVVQALIGLVWAIMAISIGWLVVVARRGHETLTAAQGDLGLLRRGPRTVPEWAVTGRHLPHRFSLAHAVVVALVVVGGALLTLLVRGPHTHANTDPDRYDGRTNVAFVGVRSVYIGPGDREFAPTGDPVADGRTAYFAHGCAGCHGLDAAGGVVAGTPVNASRPVLEQLVRSGVDGMPSYHTGVLPDEQLAALHAFFEAAREELGDLVTTTTVAPPTTVPVTTTAAGPGTTAPGASFAEVQAILDAECAGCHGSLGGWDAATRDSVVNSGNSGPAVVPGDPEASLLVARLLGAPEFGDVMPPSGRLSADDIVLIIDWIESGALE